jgi:hypothetical protein
VLAVEIIALLILLMIFLEDIRSRRVHLILFPILASCLIIIGLWRRIDLEDLLQSAWINLLFLSLILLALTAWFSLKERRLINITRQLLGWGDILFLLCIALYFSILNYIFFYMMSLIAVVIFWSLWRLFSKKDNQHIPLAGMQALILAIFLCSDWWLIHFNTTSDNWLLRFMY